MKDALRFIQAFLRNPAGIGAIAPSSKVLGQRMIKDLKFSDAQTVIELGPGTGVFTEIIREALPDKSKYLGIEINPTFVKNLTSRFPDLTFIEGSASELKQIHTDSGLPEIHSILSGLPFGTLPPDVTDGVLEAIKSQMIHGGEFRTFQYCNALILPVSIRFRRKVTDNMGPMLRSKPILWNLPPAYVFSWTKSKEQAT